MERNNPQMTVGHLKLQVQMASENVTFQSKYWNADENKNNANDYEEKSLSCARAQVLLKVFTLDANSLVRLKRPDWLRYRSCPHFRCCTFM